MTASAPSSWSRMFLRLVEALSRVRDLLRLERVEEIVGRIDRFTTLANTIEAVDSKAVAHAR